MTHERFTTILQHVGTPLVRSAFAHLHRATIGKFAGRHSYGIAQLIQLYCDIYNIFIQFSSLFFVETPKEQYLCTMSPNKKHFKSSSLG